MVGTADDEGAPLRLRGVTSIAERVRPGVSEALCAQHRAGIE